MYTVWSKDLMRMRILDVQKFRTLLSEFLLIDNKYSLYSSRGWITAKDDELIAAALMWIERTLEAIPDITTLEMIDAVLKKAFNTKYLAEDLLTDVSTLLYSTFQYLDAAFAWQTAADGTAALLVGSYTILAGILVSLGTVEL